MKQFIDCFDYPKNIILCGIGTDIPKDHAWNKLIKYVCTSNQCETTISYYLVVQLNGSYVDISNNWQTLKHLCNCDNWNNFL